MLDEAMAGALTRILNELELANQMASEILSVVPDPSASKLIITGDLIQSVNEHEARADDDPYKLERGSGQVGARTINLGDGEFAFIVSAEALFAADHEFESAEELVEDAMKVGRHLALHEAGHAALHIRGEDSGAYEDLAAGDTIHRSWRKHLAAHMDDFRIELMARRAPNPMLQVNHIGSAIAHLRSEANSAHATWRTDIDASVIQTMEASNSLVRVMAYLAAELAPPAAGVVPRPDQIPEGWDEYLEDVWNAWVLTLHRLSPADEPMSVDSIASVLSDLCALVIAWQRSIGFEYVMHPDLRQEFYWTRPLY
ncbi:MAG: hypothetical protein KF761_11150 [Salinibacterium sp.]|nr:hypothetical protein [Salinibacterium sp.]